MLAALLALLTASRLCYTRILWEGDTLPLATAGQMLHGKTIYRDIWYDKPPLVAAFHLLAGGRDGWPLRLIDALYAWLACWIAYGFARDVWSPREGLWAAGLAGFFLIFDFPATVIPVGSDLLMLAPHLAAVWLAWKRRPFWCGAMAGVAFWVSPKAHIRARGVRTMGYRWAALDRCGFCGGVRGGPRLAGRGWRPGRVLG